MYVLLMWNWMRTIPALERCGAMEIAIFTGYIIHKCICFKTGSHFDISAPWQARGLWTSGTCHICVSHVQGGTQCLLAERVHFASVFSNACVYSTLFSMNGVPTLCFSLFHFVSVAVLLFEDLPAAARTTFQRFVPNSVGHPFASTTLVHGHMAKHRWLLRTLPTCAREPQGGLIGTPKRMSGVLALGSLGSHQPFGLIGLFHVLDGLLEGTASLI